MVGGSLKGLLRKGDPVIVIAGGNSKKKQLKGKTGRIIGFLGKGRERVLVEGVNIIVHHKRQTAQGQAAGKVEKEGPLHISNVMYYVEKIKKAVRLHQRVLEDGKKVRGYIDPQSKEFVQV